MISINRVTFNYRKIVIVFLIILIWKLKIKKYLAY